MSIELAWVCAFAYAVTVVGLSYAAGRAMKAVEAMSRILSSTAKKWADHAMSSKAPSVVAAEQELERSRLAILARMQERGVSPDVQTQLWQQSMPTPAQAQAEFSGRQPLDDEVD